MNILIVTIGFMLACVIVYACTVIRPLVGRALAVAFILIGSLQLSYYFGLSSFEYNQKTDVFQGLYRMLDLVFEGMQSDVDREDFVELKRKVAVLNRDWDSVKYVIEEDKSKQAAYQSMLKSLLSDSIVEDSTN